MTKANTVFIILLTIHINSFGRFNAESAYKLYYIVTPKEDSVFEKRISAFTCMPNGREIILNVLKVDRTEKNPPLAKKFRFNIATGTIELLPIDGGGLTVSPNGKTVAYIKQVDGKDQIYLYNFSSKEDKQLVNDTLKKYAISWSPNGQNLIYNIQTGKGAKAKVEICTYEIERKKAKQITKNSTFKCYTPAWNPKDGKIVYTAEKGDKHDQIYLSDKNGSDHTNLTNDTTTHNYSPTWLDKETIIYIQAPSTIVSMKVDRSQKQITEGISTTQFKFNSVTNELIYLDSEENLMLYNMKSKTKKVVIQNNKLNDLFNDSYYR